MPEIGHVKCMKKYNCKLDREIYLFIFEWERDS